MQLTFQGQTYSVEGAPTERLQTVSVYKVPADYQGGLFVAITPAGEFEQVPASLGVETVLLLRGVQSPGEALVVEFQAEGVTIG